MIMICDKFIIERRQENKMEKKNTLLLTVIAVATLLVAVVGATFAYFGSFDVQTTNKAGVNVSTEAAKESSLIVTSASIKSIPYAID